MSYSKKVFLLIAVSAALKLFFASTTELSADEVYYWTYALKLQWNYFDHPPIVALLIRLTTLNLLLHNEIFVRLGAIISSGICTWLMFKIGTVINNQRTGWFAALLYTSSVYCNITIGLTLLPDSPQMIFWLSGILILIRLSRLTDNTAKADLLWCLFGLITGLCIMSKVHGVFLWVGAILYVLVIDRKWLKQRGVYLSTIITLVIISPIIIWNIQNNFINYRFHGSRVSLIGSGVHLKYFFKAIFEAITGNNPINFFLIISGLIWALREKNPVYKKEIKILLFCSLPLIVLLLIISLFRETFAHWSGPAYSCLLILPAVKLATVSKSSKLDIPNIIKVALAYMVFIAALQPFIINYFPGTLSVQKQGPKTGTDDITLDMYGWNDLGEKFDSLYKSDIAQKRMPPNTPIIVTNWSPGSSIEYYIASKTKQEVIGIGTLVDLHQYYYSNSYKRQLKDGDSAYFIVPSDSFYYRTSNEVNKHFKSYELPLVIPQYRSGIICRYISIYRMRGYKK